MSGERAAEPLLTTDVEHRLARLTFPLRHAVHSRVLGQHRSRMAGSSIEFDELREYHPGDDLRRVDWKASARLDRVYVKQTIQEASAAAMILMDSSASMTVGGEAGAAKLRHAAELAAALSCVLLHQADPVGMLCTDGRGGVERIPPHRHPAHYHRLLTALEDLCRPGRAGHDGSRALPAALAEGLRLAELEHWHDETLLVISDFLFPFEELLGRLDRLSQRNNRAFLFHVIHPDEYSPTVTAGIPDWSIPARETFPFLEVCRFRSPETGALVLADPRMVRREYVHRFRELLGELRSRAAECGIGYEPVGTGEAVEAFLMRWLWRG